MTMDIPPPPFLLEEVDEEAAEPLKMEATPLPSSPTSGDPGHSTAIGRRTRHSITGAMGGTMAAAIADAPSNMTEPDVVAHRNRHSVEQSIAAAIAADLDLSASDQEQLALRHRHSNMGSTLDHSVNLSDSNPDQHNSMNASQNRTMTMSIRHKNNRRTSTKHVHVTPAAPSAMRVGTTPGRHPSNASSYSSQSGYYSHSSGISSTPSFEYDNHHLVQAPTSNNVGQAARFMPPSRIQNLSGASSTNSGLSGISGVSTRSGVSSGRSRRSSAAGSEKRGLRQGSFTGSTTSSHHSGTGMLEKRGRRRTSYNPLAPVTSSIAPPPFAITEESLAQLEASHGENMDHGNSSIDGSSNNNNRRYGSYPLAVPADSVGVGAFHVSEPVYVDPLQQQDGDEDAGGADHSHSSYQDPSFRDDMYDGSSTGYHHSHPSMSGSDRHYLESDEPPIPQLPQATISSSQRHVMADNSSSRRYGSSRLQTSREHRSSQRNHPSARHQYRYPAVPGDDNGYSSPVETAPGPSPHDDPLARSPRPQEPIRAVSRFFAKRQEHEQGLQRVTTRRNRCRFAIVCMIVLGIILAVVLIVTFTVLWGHGTITTDANSQAVDMAEKHLPDLPGITTQAFRRPDSPQTHAILWLGQDPDLETMEHDRKEQRFAVATILYRMALSSSIYVEDFGGSALPAFVETWLPYGQDECALDHYECNDDGHLTSISFNAAILRSSSPSIEEDTVSEGDEGKPPLMGLPAELSLLTALESLLLGENDWTGVLVENFLQLPPTVSALTNLNTLSCPNCGLEGTLPETWPTILSNLTHLDLGNNIISSALPASWGQWSSLINLNLGGNHLNSTLPSEIGLMTAISVLDLDSNLFSGNLPSELLLLTNLDTLALRNNLLMVDQGDYAYALLANLSTNVASLETDGNTPTSKIPTESVVYRQLKDARVNFAGMIPSEIGLWTDLESLELSHSALRGSIPTEIGLMAALTDLDLADSDLTGTLPTELGLLKNLTKMDVYKQLLSGQIPSELGCATSLVDMNLAQNMLSGTLPEELDSLTNLATLYIYGQFGDRMEQSAVKRICEASSLGSFGFRSDRCQRGQGDCC